MLGRGVYETRARTGRLLVADLPAASTALWATVDQNPVSPLRSAEGRWLVPLGDQGPYRVSLFWSEPAQAATAAQAGWPLTLPRVGVERVPTLLTVHLPDGLTIKPSAAALELSTADRIALERRRPDFAPDVRVHRPDGPQLRPGPGARGGDADLA